MDPKPKAAAQVRSFRWIARGFWVAVVVLCGVWVLIPARRDQATLLFRGWYPGMARLLEGKPPEIDRVHYRLDHLLLTRYWLASEGRAPHALEAAMRDFGDRARTRFDEVVKPLTARWLQRPKSPSATGIDAETGWHANFGASSGNNKDGAATRAEIQTEGTAVSGPAAQRLYSRRAPEAALLFLFPSPPPTGRIGDGLRWRFKIPAGRVPAAPWQLRWATGSWPQFDTDRVVLLAPRFDSQSGVLTLIADMRAFPDWIADEPLLALHLALPTGDDPQQLAVEGLDGVNSPSLPPSGE